MNDNISMKQKAEFFDMICDYLYNHPDTYENNECFDQNNIEDVKLGDKKSYTIDTYKNFDIHNRDTWYRYPNNIKLNTK